MDYDLYNGSIKYVEKINQLYNEFIKSNNEHMNELYKHNTLMKCKG